MSELSELLAKKTCSTCRYRMAAPMEHWDTWHCVAPQNYHILGDGTVVSNSVTGDKLPKYITCVEARSAFSGCHTGDWWVQSYYVGGSESAGRDVGKPAAIRARGLASTKLEDI